jgi:hypothetical protein
LQLNFRHQLLLSHSHQWQQKQKKKQQKNGVKRRKDLDVTKGISQNEMKTFMGLMMREERKENFIKETK